MDNCNECSDACESPITIGDSYHESYPIVKHDFKCAGEVSAAIKRLLRRMGLDFGLIRRVAIAAYECELNLVIHSMGGRIDLDIYPPGDDGVSWIYICSCDVGPGIRDLTLAMQEGWSTATDDVRDLGFGAGMGLPNMKRNADSFDIESEYEIGTTIKMGFRIT